VGGNPIDLRVAILPTIYGESCVMRVLDRSNVELSLDRVGLREDDLETFGGLIRKPNGIVVVTGPTGSGKTTTLYAALASSTTSRRRSSPRRTRSSTTSTGCASARSTPRWG
jgi:type IV pilus assembly protein PilB